MCGTCGRERLGGQSEVPPAGRPLFVVGDRITVEAGYHGEGPGELRLLVTEEVPGPFRTEHVQIRGVPLGEHDAVVGAPLTVCVTPVRIRVDQ